MKLPELTSGDYSKIRKLEYVLFGLLILFLVPIGLDYQSQPFSKGITKVLDLTFLNQAVIFWSLKILGIVLFFAGLIPRFRLLFWVFHFAFLGLIFSFTQAQGIVNHSAHLAVLILLGLILANLVQLKMKFEEKALWLLEHQFAVVLSVSLFLTSVISKIMLSKGFWVVNAPEILTKIVKNNDQKFFDHLSPEYLDRMDQIVEYLISHPQMLQITLGIFILIELSPLLAVFKRSWKYFIGFLLIIMHCLIANSMSINFATTIIAEAIIFLELGFVLVLFSKVFSRAGTSNNVVA